MQVGLSKQDIPAGGLLCCEIPVAPPWEVMLRPEESSERECCCRGRDILHQEKRGNSIVLRSMFTFFRLSNSTLDGKKHLSNWRSDPGYLCGNR
jgi:hypothetical protein